MDIQGTKRAQTLSIEHLGDKFDSVAERRAKLSSGYREHSMADEEKKSKNNNSRAKKEPKKGNSCKYILSLRYHSALIHTNRVDLNQSNFWKRLVTAMDGSQWNGQPICSRSSQRSNCCVEDSERAQQVRRKSACKHCHWLLVVACTAFFSGVMPKSTTCTLSDLM